MSLYFTREEQDDLKTEVARLNTDKSDKVGVQNSSYTYGESASASDAYSITLDPAPSSLVSGQRFSFKADVGNTDGASLEVN